MDADGSNQKLFKATEGMHIRSLTVSPTGDSFLFQRDYKDREREAPFDYFVVNVDGSGLTRLSEYSRYETSCGKFSPHGSKVAYLSNDVSSGGSMYAIYTVNADGSGKVRFDLKGGLWGEPYFSPDGKKVAFINDDDYFPNGNVFLVDVDGRNLRQLTNYGDDPFEKTYGPARRIGALDKGLTFSPDGRRILYCSAEFGSSDIFAVDVDGTGKTRLTDFADCEESAPIFVRGGGEILFTVEGGEEKSGVWIMKADGSAKKKLLGHLWPVLAVSRDGEKAAYTNYYPDINSKKHTLYVGGPTRRIRIADEQGVFWDVSFSPDGEKVLYRQDGGVFVANADGSGRKKLADWWDSFSNPAFYADGAKIAFVVKSSVYPFRYDIYTVDADGSNRKLFKVTEGMRIKDLVVSPAGGRFLFESYVDDRMEYFAVNADGSGLAPLSAYNPPPYDEAEE
jgi:Tol biopolymer transport system component